MTVRPSSLQDSPGRGEFDLNARNGYWLAELGLWSLGLLAILVFFFARAGGELERQNAIAQFNEVRAQRILAGEGINEEFGSAADLNAQSSHAAATPLNSVESAAVEPSFPSDRSTGIAVRDAPAPAREAASGSASAVLPIAILSIPAVGLEVPVFEDTSERNLNRGAGWIEGTAGPNDGGNMAIAAHRDGYFRALKDVKVGQHLDLVSLNETQRYRVTEVLIVDPEEVWVLAPTEADAVTLVTCYPFYFVGNAPQRYIVRALIDD